MRPRLLREASWPEVGDLWWFCSTRSSCSPGLTSTEKLCGAFTNIDEENVLLTLFARSIPGQRKLVKILTCLKAQRPVGLIWAASSPKCSDPAITSCGM